jgi:uncharacterized protein DUF3551
MRTKASLTIALAALATANVVSLSDSRAATYGNAPWCAVTNNGAGDMEWDCEYQSIAQCAPQVVAGNRGFCNLNPAGPQYAPAPVSHRKHRHS